MGSEDNVNRMGRELGMVCMRALTGAMRMGETNDSQE
jgi:hypothetical protein